MSQFRTILQTTAAKHKMHAREILSRDRSDRVVAARREVILALHNLGMKPGMIARLMQRERTTILEYINPTRAAWKAQYHAANWKRWQAGRKMMEAAGA